MLFCMDCKARSAHRGTQVDIRGNALGCAVGGRFFVRSATRDCILPRDAGAFARALRRCRRVDTELCVVDTWKRAVDTELCVVDTWKRSVDTELSVVDTWKCSVDTELFAVDPWKRSIDTELCGVDRWKNPLDTENFGVVTGKSRSAGRPGRRGWCHHAALKLSSRTGRSRRPCAGSHAKSPPPGMRSTVFR